MSQCIGLFEVIWSTHNNSVKVLFRVHVIWSTMALQLKLITCVYNVLFVKNIGKLMFTPAVLTSLDEISHVILIQCEINGPKIPRNDYFVRIFLLQRLWSNIFSG